MYHNMLYKDNYHELSEERGPSDPDLISPYLNKAGDSITDDLSALLHFSLSKQS